MELNMTATFVIMWQTLKVILPHMSELYMKEFINITNLCDYKSTKKNNLRQHVESIHIAILNYDCRLCKYMASTKCNFDLHVKSKHIEEETLFIKGQLKNHKLIHSEKKPINCDECDKCFRLKSG